MSVLELFMLDLGHLLYKPWNVVCVFHSALKFVYAIYPRYSYICISSVIRNKDFQSPYPSNPQLPDSEVTYFQRSIQSLTAAVSCPSQQDLPSTSIENNRYICSRALQKKRKGQESQAGLWLMSKPTEPSRATPNAQAAASVPLCASRGREPLLSRKHTKFYSLSMLHLL